MANITSQEITDSFITKNESGEITAIAFDEFDKLVNELVTKRAELRNDNKELVKAGREAENAEKAIAGEDYFDSLKVGDLFTYTDAKGNVIELKKIETKSKSGATAAGEMTNPPAGAKSTKRYPKFYQLNVPAANEKVA